MPHFICPFCTQELSSKGSVAGQQFKCPRCSKDFQVPGCPEEVDQVWSAPPGPSDYMTQNPAQYPPPPAAQVMPKEPGWPPYQPQQPQQPQPPYGQPQQQYQPYPQYPQYQMPHERHHDHSSNMNRWLIIGVGVLLALVLYMQFSKSSSVSPVVPVPAPSPEPTDSLFVSANQVVKGDTEAAYYLARVFTRAAELIDRDGKGQKLLSRTDHVAETLTNTLGSFAVGGKFEGRFTGLPELVVDTFKKSGFPTVEEDLTPEARASAVKTYSTLAAVFLRVADKEK